MISATIITLNEQEKISKALEGLEGLAREIIVVDSGSSDKTLEIARKYGAKTYFRKFDNFANQKNFALSKANGEWIISLDADEEIPQILAEEIKKSIKNTKYSGFLIPRRNFILGAQIKHSRWSPDKHIWLWKKGYGQWVGDVHEEVAIEGEAGELQNSKIHNSHKTISEFLNANNLYSTLEAQAIKDKTGFSLLNMFWDAFFEFFIRFFYKKGFLDGKKGFALSYIMAVYKLSVAVKLWELKSRK